MNLGELYNGVLGYTEIKWGMIWFAICIPIFLLAVISFPIWGIVYYVGKLWETLKSKMV